MDPNDKTNQTPTGDTGTDQSAPGMPPSEQNTPPPTVPDPSVPQQPPGDGMTPKQKPNMFLVIAFVVVLIGGALFFFLR